MKKACTRILFLLCWLSAQAQQEATTWYFGKQAGIAFTPTGVQALTQTALNTEEGCSVISDQNGNLLFYTDGITVWNRRHEAMPNGRNLLGDPSSTQSSVVIAAPDVPGKYYVFTIAATAGSAGMRYSVVEMQRNNGWGDVVPDKKNIPLMTPVSEKMTAVKHRNGKDSWVITHGWNNAVFAAYLVSNQGVSSTPVRSEVGSIHEGDLLNTQGYLKANPDGSNLALALEASDVLELFDFDNATGKVSQPIRIPVKPKSYIYGIEFSPSGSVLYVSAAGTGEIYQFHLQERSAASIQASGTVIGRSPNKAWIGALQIGNDGKIYYPIYQTPYLGVIHEPEVLGAACRMENNYVFLNQGVAMLGLPTFTQSFFAARVAEKPVRYFHEQTIQLHETYVLKNVYFDVGSFALKPASHTELAKLAALLAKNPTWTIELSGHTDNIGNKPSNIVLSENRAKAVQQYLIAQGISAARLSFRGFGSALPIASNETEAGRGKNRRVSFVLRAPTAP